MNINPIAADVAQGKPIERKSYDYPVRMPDIMPGVVPANQRSGIQLATDAAPDIYQILMNGGFSGFPGFSYLAQLATRPEYRNMVGTHATELTREWIKFTSAQDDDSDTNEKIKAIVKAFDDLKIRQVIRKVAENDGFFGRGQIFIGLRNQDRSKPLILDPATIPIGSLERVVSVEPIWTTPSGYNALDPAAPDFYKPSHWFMLGQHIHASRLLTITTRPLPDMLKPAFNFAGMSLSQLAEPYVDNWLRTRQSVSDLIDKFSMTFLQTDMAQILAGNNDGSNLLTRAKLFATHKSNQGLGLIDKDKENIVQVNTPLSGLHELQAQAQEQMCSVSRTPAIILTGISPSGLNASSEGEIRTFYDWIAATQEADYREPITILFHVVQLSLFGEIDPDLSFEFCPLYQMTPKELADIRAADGQTDCNYIAAGVVAADEVREKLAKDPNSGYQGLDTGDVPIMPTAPEDEDNPANDASVSEAQHRAMEAAAHGKSTLGIPEKVGKEFVSKDADFKEGDHPRAENGQFGSGSEKSSGSAPSYEQVAELADYKNTHIKKRESKLNALRKQFPEEVAEHEKKFRAESLAKSNAESAKRVAESKTTETETDKKKREEREAQAVQSEKERSENKARYDRAAASVEHSAMGQSFTPDEIESIQSYFKSGDRHGANQEARNATVSAIGREAEKAGMTVEHVSESDSGKGKSLYIRNGDELVRVSDHELPMTAKRENDRANGLTGKWDREVVVNDWQSTSVQDYINEIKG